LFILILHDKESNQALVAGFAQVSTVVAVTEAFIRFLRMEGHEETFFMNITPIAAAASANSAELTRNMVGLSVLKKAIDIEAAGALALVQAIPTPPPAGTAGGVVDTWA